ncbi:MAG: hypothetical protein H0U58_10850, partial [Chloroflexi bacterium]|nr:hypothetical protein [Chloroflexota bacterium]
MFAIFHPPADGVPRQAAVLICPPWGWDEVASYRSRRTWADDLAQRGHPTLRIDFPGSGDSGGTPTSPDRVGAWTAAVVAATRWLADSTEGGRITVIGLGLGGLVAGRSLAHGAQIDDLILWASPTTGRALLRQQRAFAELQSRDLAAGEVAEALPDGGLEIGGFLQSAETIAALGEVDLRAIAPGPLRRLLLLERDGIAVDARLGGHFSEAGVEVSTAPGVGWEAMCFHPEQYRPPLEVFDRVAAWIDSTTGSPTAKPDLSSSPRITWHGESHSEFAIDSIALRETALWRDAPFGGFFGVLSEGVDVPRSDLCAVFLNAGAIRRIGPNRLWVEAGRRWAASGVPTVRVDVEALGDADGDATMYADLSRFYTPNRGPQVTAILDALEASGAGSRFILIGLCAGAYSAFTAAALDDRVIGAIAINPRILIWDPTLLDRRDAALVKRVFEPGSWRRILRGQTSIAAVLAIARAALGQIGRVASEIAGRVR